MPHSYASSVREQAIFHLLLGELMAARWRQGLHDIEVLKSEVDRGGYDIVLEANGVLRHIQLKSTFSGSAVRHVTVSTRLLDKPSGCVIWLEVNPRTLALESYLWFGDRPGIKLPDLGARVSRHSRGDRGGQKAERPMHRDLSKACFERLSGIDELLIRLFG
ncbi:hypothetical protein C7U92_06845 [Bradyrhizobium sp. WBOS7]|uniref:Uncharacterized protein n=2 Tax=Nitrobacteraceae TaxID=41294 RepID=A0AAE9NGQ3_9BRAD|nr:hypothetical protein [Bradyrhizobium sp. WBOS2]MDD1569335.1 hypothetical protein [Bradyrhizobium sp. WBOS1]MDD1576454.1 hypothetical protein [Bradyrhizobium sp. WBOS7]MDD1602295.1 hypothetical protein [Bradyrhizobium sp. WBOS16]UUO38130.1 hypothetical protein DCK84_28455 [Bradyrhizobium sp. WBOS01]UUO44296.1 hypothetical protein DCM75_28425 [Bradyrhizobium sp. WBOS02]UUO54704.1 hypothetical protein DCM79_18020 [Bradyrhizobium sp. WBOS07]UUO68705.1 hypothetical protein DCM83_28130 [Bradyrh